jgi:hypothetical protein
MSARDERMLDGILSYFLKEVRRVCAFFSVLNARAMGAMLRLIFSA